MPYDTDPLRPDTRDAIEQDSRLQPDPELKLGSGRAGTAQIALTGIAAFAIIALVLYGLNNQREETAASEPPQTTAQSQPSGQSAVLPNAPQGETTGSGGTTKPGTPQTGRSDSSQQGAPTQATAPQTPPAKQTR